MFLDVFWKYVRRPLLFGEAPQKDRFQACPPYRDFFGGPRPPENGNFCFFAVPVRFNNFRCSGFGSYSTEAFVPGFRPKVQSRLLARRRETCHFQEQKRFSKGVHLRAVFLGGPSRKLGRTTFSRARFFSYDCLSWGVSFLRVSGLLLSRSLGEACLFWPGFGEMVLLFP